MRNLVKRNPLILILIGMVIALVPAASLVFGLNCCTNASAYINSLSLKPVNTTNYHSNPAPFRGNLQRTGVYKNTGTPRLDKLLWTIGTGDFTDGFSVVDNLAFNVNDNGLQAIDTATGQITWTIKDTNQELPTIKDGILYYVNKGTLYRLWDRVRK